MSRRATSRGALLELAILGLLQDSPMHGYELRKQLNALLGAFRALSYGTLYPCLRDLLSRGWIGESLPSGINGSRRARIVYELTADGKDHFQALISYAGPSAWEDDTFSVHFAFFARTEAEVRLRILEGRRTRLEERLDTFRAAAAQRRERLDLYTAELQRHGLDSAEREVRWLSELIETERTRPNSAAPHRAAPHSPAPHSPAPHSPAPHSPGPSGEGPPQT